MNRHQRRANRKTQHAEVKRVPINELLNARKACAWVGCVATFQGEMPKGGLGM